MVKKSKKPVEGLIRTYLSAAIRTNDKQNDIEVFVRDRIKWIFDYLRNMMMVGLVIFLEKYQITTH
jgi:hypothetical protein